FIFVGHHLLHAVIHCATFIRSPSSSPSSHHLAPVSITVSHQNQQQRHFCSLIESKRKALNHYHSLRIDQPQITNQHLQKTKNCNPLPRATLRHPNCENTVPS
ncbi:hypothetical protein VIGAN_04141100, partial [Vigna angularis var. angularis]